MAESRHVRTLPQQYLKDIGLHFQVLPRKGGVTTTLRFRRLSASPDTTVSHTAQAQHLLALATLWGGQAAKADGIPTGPLPKHSPIRIVPRAAEEHRKETGHNVIARADKKRTCFALDLPVPLMMDITPMRCRSPGCAANNTCYFPVLMKDIHAHIPGILHWQASKFGEVFLSERMLLYLVQSFYEKLNMRSLRRGLVEYYATNMLAFNLTSSASTLLQAVPQSGTFAALLVSGMERFLAEP